MDLGIKDQVVMITGAGSGIGRTCAKVFAREGAHIALVDRDPGGMHTTITELSGFDVGAKAFEADVTSPESVTRAVEDIEDGFRRIDALINSAGVYREVPVEKLSLEEWEQTIRVNLSGSFLCSQAAIPSMKKQGKGSIVNIASLAGQVGGLVAGADYSVSKAGVIGLTKSLARAVAKCGVRVNTISPGPCESPMTAKWPPKRKAEFEKTVPLGRLGRPEDVANTALFLCSDLASYIHGARIDVNGGLHMD